MKLFYSKGSCSLAAHILAREADLPCALESVNPKTKQTEEGVDFLIVNPKGYVPALALEDGTLLTEGGAVFQYIADQAPEAGLLPRSGTRERYRAVEWIHFIATELHKSWSILFDRAAEPAYKQLVREKLDKRLQLVDAQLKLSPFLLGTSFTAPDAYLFTVLRWAPFTNVKLPERLAQYVATLSTRPSVSKAMEFEGLRQ